MVCTAASKCSQTNMMRCLDSVCAINIGMNPAARCQYCGTSLAGTPTAQKGLKNVSVGQSSKYAFTDKELAVAPSDPGKRYIWATGECIKKVGNCTTDDVSNIYDKLIEQSCKAAGINMQTDRAIVNMASKPSQTLCTRLLEAGIEAKCGTQFDNCNEDSDIDRIVSECITQASGCAEYAPSIKSEYKAKRAKTFESRENALQQIVQDYQNGRQNTWDKTVADCKNDTAEKSCHAKYQDAFGTKIATLICEYYKRACNTISTGR